MFIFSNVSNKNIILLNNKVLLHIIWHYYFQWLNTILVYYYTIILQGILMCACVIYVLYQLRREYPSPGQGESIPNSSLKIVLLFDCSGIQAFFIKREKHPPSSNISTIVIGFKRTVLYSQHPLQEIRNLWFSREFYPASLFIIY